MSSTLSIYQLDGKRGFEIRSEMEGKPDPHRIYINNSNKPYLEFIYSASNNLINLRWSWEKIEIALGPDINATLNIPAC